ncbi:MAG: hypothetical protein K2R98_21260 [Gemmataceae bacterium]|nr:hypothetical protein [Gemmataceae bacterium]
MCRIAAYFGPPIPLSAVLHDPPHGLEHQSQAARQMSGGSVAGDGWGVGWFLPGEATPGLLKSILPLWSDQNAKTVSSAVVSGTIVGHIRLASGGIEVCFINTPLYVLGQHLFTINGELKPWPGALSRALRARLDDKDEAAVQGSTDAEMLGALWHTYLRRTPPVDEAAALRAALGEARRQALEQGGAIKANVIIASHDGVLAARYAEPDEPNTLYCLTEEDRWPGGTLIASEPLDDGPGWKAVKPNTLVRVDRHGLHREPLALEASQHRGSRARSASLSASS